MGNFNRHVPLLYTKMRKKTSSRDAGKRLAMEGLNGTRYLARSPDPIPGRCYRNVCMLLSRPQFLERLLFSRIKFHREVKSISFDCVYLLHSLALSTTGTTVSRCTQCLGRALSAYHLLATVFLHFYQV